MKIDASWEAEWQRHRETLPVSAVGSERLQLSSAPLSQPFKALRAPSASN